MRSINVKVKGLEPASIKVGYFKVIRDDTATPTLISHHTLNKVLGLAGWPDCADDNYTVNIAELLKELPCIAYAPIIDGLEVTVLIDAPLWQIRRLPNYTVYRFDALNATKLNVSVENCTYGFTIQPDLMLEPGKWITLDKRTHVVLRAIKFSTIEKYMDGRALSAVIDVLRARGDIVTLDSPLRLVVTPASEIIGDEVPATDIIHL